MARGQRFGVSAALSTPFREDGQVDIDRLAAHAHDLLARDCRSVTLFGTTGEGPSVSIDERNRVAAELVGSGIEPTQLCEGVIACSIEEASLGTRRALERGSRAVLLAPPFYFRDAPDDAVLAWFAEVFGQVGGTLRDVILYHIPGMTGVPLSLGLIGRLRSEFPEAIIGVKDSACDRAATLRLIEAHGDLTILVGDETYLGEACAAGAAGSICGLANLIPEVVSGIVESGRDDPRIKDLIAAITRHPVIPIVKALVGHVRDDPAWRRARPPLPSLGDNALRSVVPALDLLRTPVAVPA